MKKNNQNQQTKNSSAPVRRPNSLPGFIKKPWFLFLLLFTTVIFIYIPAVNVPPYLDDYSAILNNPRVTQIANLPLIFSDFFVGRGMVQLTFALEWHTFKNIKHAIHAMHITNIVFHLITILLVYFFARVCWKFFYPQIQDETHWKYHGWIAACVFAIHPINTQPVTYIISRADVMVTIFYLLGIIFPLIILQKYWIGTHSIQCKALAFGTSLLALGTFFILGFSCKEIIITLPAVFVLLCLYAMRNQPLGYLIRKIVLFCIPILIAMGSYLLYRKMKTGSYLYFPDMEVRTPWINFYTQICIVAMYYFPRIILPVNLLLRPPFPLAVSFFDLRLIFSGSFLLGILAGAIFCFRKKPVISFGILWFFITLSPTSTFLPLWDIIAERRLYLPMVGIALAIESLSLHFLISKPTRIKRTISCFLICGYIFFSALTWMRNIEFQNPILLWYKEHKFSPYNLENLHSYLFNLSAAGQEEKVKEVLIHLDWERIKKENEFIDTGSLDALIRLMLHHKVEVEYATALAQKNANEFPRDIERLNTYQLALMVQLRFRDAMDIIDQALKINPKDLDTLFNKAYIYRIFSLYEDARTCLNQILQIDPNYVSALEELVEVYKATNQDPKEILKRIEQIKKNQRFQQTIDLKSSL